MNRGQRGPLKGNMGPLKAFFQGLLKGMSGNNRLRYRLRNYYRYLRGILRTFSDVSLNVTVIRTSVWQFLFFLSGLQAEPTAYSWGTCWIKLLPDFWPGFFYHIFWSLMQCLARFGIAVLLGQKKIKTAVLEALHKSRNKLSIKLKVVSLTDTSRLGARIEIAVTFSVVIFCFWGHTSAPSSRTSTKFTWNSSYQPPGRF